MLFKECQSNEFYIMIKDFCLDELRREMRIAGKDFNDELGDFTCNCFFNKIQSGESLILARRTCKEEVSKKYKL